MMVYYRPSSRLAHFGVSPENAHKDSREFKRASGTGEPENFFFARRKVTRESRSRRDSKPGTVVPGERQFTRNRLKRS
jgi:hypothetical protein